MDNLNAQECLTRGIALLRSNKADEAVPFLEVAVKAGVGKFSSDLLRTARALADGVEVVDVNFGGRNFKFALVFGNVGLDLHHVVGRFFEIDELVFCQKIVPARGVIVDVGANTGNNVIFYCGFLNPSLVIPIEPVSQTVDILRRNLQLNGMVVDERGFGVAAAASVSDLSLDDNRGKDMTVFSVRARHQSETGTSIRGIPLDDLVPERVDFLKIDVEGFEHSVLSGADRILSEDKPILCMEVNDDDRQSLLAKVAQYGYQPIREFPGFKYKNVFFRVG